MLTIKPVKKQMTCLLPSKLRKRNKSVSEENVKTKSTKPNLKNSLNETTAQLKKQSNVSKIKKPKKKDKKFLNKKLLLKRKLKKNDSESKRLKNGNVGLKLSRKES